MSGKAPNGKWEVPILARVLASFLAILLLTIQMLTGSDGPVNTVSGMLVVLFFLPWLIHSIESIEFPGLAKLTAPREDTATDAEIERKASRDAAAIPQAPTSVSMGEIGRALDHQESAISLYQAFETAALTGLIRAGFDEVRRRVAIVTPDGHRYVPDAIARVYDTSYVVEVKLGLPAQRIRPALAELERTVHLYSQVKPNEHVAGLLVLGGVSVEDIRSHLGISSPVLVSVVAFDADSGEFGFPYDNPFWWNRRGV